MNHLTGIHDRTFYVLTWDERSANVTFQCPAYTKGGNLTKKAKDKLKELGLPTALKGVRWNFCPPIEALFNHLLAERLKKPT